MSDTTPPAADGQVPPTPPQQPAPAPAGPYTAAEDQNLAAWAHLGVILYWLPPLIIWLIGKDRGPRTNVEGKEALNMGIVATIAQIVQFIVFGVILALIPFVGLIFLIISWLLWIGIWVLLIVFGIQGFQKVNQGGSFRYPSWVLPFRLIK